MKLQLITISLISIAIFAGCANQDKNDTKKNTIFFDENVELVDYYASECDAESNPYIMRNRIISKIIKDDSLFLTLGFSDNCCVEFDPQITVAGNILYLNLIDEEQSEYCDCDCCFELTLVITGIRDTGFVTVLNDDTIQVSSEKYLTYPEEYEIKNGDTINRINKYRFREGLWIETNDTTGVVTSRIYYSGTDIFGDEIVWGEIYFPDGSMKKKWNKDSSLTYYESGSIAERRMSKEYREFTETFYLNGKINSRCEQWWGDNPDKNVAEEWNEKCKYWDEQGRVIRTTKY